MTAEQITAKANKIDKILAAVRQAAILQRKQHDEADLFFTLAFKSAHDLDAIIRRLP